MHKILAIIICILGGVLPAMSQNTDSLKVVINSSPNTRQQVQSLNALSKAYKAKDTQAAIKYAQQSIEVAKKIKYQEGLADAYANLGQASAFLADEQSDPTEGYEKAAQYFRQSFDLYDKLYSQGKLSRTKMLRFLEGGVITVYRDLADIYYSEKKNYKQASDKYRMLFTRFGEYSSEIKDESLVVSRTKLLNQKLNQELLEKKQQALKNELQIKKVEKEKDSLALANQRRKIESAKREIRLRALQSENLKIQKENEEKAHRLKIAAQEAQLKRSRLLTTSMIVGFVLVFVIVGVLFYSYRRQKKVNQIISRQQAEIVEAKERSETLLLNILPREVAEELKESGKASIRQYEMVSVLFTDFKGFTSIAEKITPVALVRELETCFLRFDEIIEKYNIEKIKTIGDAYMAAGGIPIANQTNPLDVILAGLEMQRYMNELKAVKQAAGEPYWELRLGINTGKLIAGVIGKKKFAYDVWGDTVNTASRMESSGEVGKVNISGKTYELVKEFFECEHRGKVTAKGKGEIDMYFVRRIKVELSADEKGLVPNEQFKNMRDGYNGLAVAS
ncbi:adenylate/guanylate cyclase domain-containing protein [uncultured Microscilla sp.]|uniref:adenylate/guanylate cyclase domain-containing protein n=1 Tax=uncultured Microscilla sp. TaxID=432653 RepID=UPI002620D865|nr:adenylate/guanylate cyclase domain-containing protein [uncultured Microscilla sp.]